jgi:hypothetical protein
LVRAAKPTWHGLAPPDRGVNKAAGKAAGVYRPLYVWAISAKRYALFNLDADGGPILRKASVHGLGHLLPPYIAADPAPGIPAPSDDRRRSFAA